MNESGFRVAVNGQAAATLNVGVVSSFRGPQGEPGRDGMDAPQDAVRYGEAQALDEAQQAQARANIGAASAQEMKRLEDDLSAGAQALPEYLRSEADAVIDRVMAAQSERCFVMAAITDLHYGCGGYTDGVKHACQALAYIDARIRLDAVAVLGDYTDGRPGTEGQTADSISDFRAVNAVLDALRCTPNLRLQGNHDYYEGHVPEIYRYIQAYSDGLTWGDAVHGYGHRDFDRCRLRVICLNTSELSDSASITYSDKQAQWFAGVLDLSGKEDAADWQILVLSHHPVDFDHEDGKAYVFAELMDAYVDGKSYASGDISYDYSGRNQAKLIGNIHGHIHNLLVSRIFSERANAEDWADVLRIATPEACFGRPNGYEGVWQEAATHPKTQGTAYDTAFVVYCIGLDTHKITAVCYGAGYHRVIDYDALTCEATAKDDVPGDGGQDTPIEPSGYTNQLLVATDASGSTVVDGMMYPNAKMESGEIVSSSSHWISGFIPIAPGDMVRIRWHNTNTASGNIALRSYDADKQPLYRMFPFNLLLDPANEALDFANSDGYQFDYAAGILDFTAPTNAFVPEGTAYMLFILNGDAGEAIVTVNEAIE